VDTFGSARAMWTWNTSPSAPIGFSSRGKANKIMRRERGVEKLRRVVDIARRLWPD